MSLGIIFGENTVSDITDGSIHVTVCVCVTEHDTEITAVTNVLCVIRNIFVS
jgi:hypothetical protein